MPRSVVPVCLVALLVSAALVRGADETCVRSVGGAEPLVNGAIKSAVYGDFDEDGRIDVALDMNANQRIIALNRGGVFVPKPFEGYIGVNGNYINLRAAADVNGDGHLDLIYRYYVSTWVALGRGDGTFQPVIPSPAPAHNFVYGDSRSIDLHHNGSIAFIDLDHLAGVVSLVESNGDGTFRDTAHYAWYTSPDAAAITAGDFDGDGRLDAEWVRYDGVHTRVTVGFNDGSATLQQTQIIIDGQFTSFQPVDIDGDGAEELLGIADGVLAVIRSKDRHLASETMRISPAGTLAMRHPSAVDLNGDGILDVVFSNGNTAGVLWGAAQPRFSGVSYFALPGSVYGWNVAAVDIDGDGVPDLASTGGTTGLYALFGSTLRSKQPNANRVLNPDGTANPLAVSDVDGDGIRDIIARFGTSGTDRVAALLGDGHGGYPRMTKPYVLEQYKPWIVFAADFDGDGRVDIAVTPPQNVAGTQKTTVVFGSSDGFGNAIDLDADYLAGSVFLGPSSPSAIVALKGTEIRLLTISAGRAVSSSVIGSLPAASQLFTVHSDPSLPAQIAYLTRPNFLRVLTLKSGEWTEALTAPYLYDFGGTAGGASADVNGDGRPDYVFWIDSYLAVFMSRTDGTYELGHMDTNLSSLLSWLTFADVNGDGVADLVSVGDEAAVGPRVQAACYSGGRFTKCGGAAMSAGGTPVVADIDGNGRNEVLAGSADGIELVANVCATPAVRAVALPPNPAQGGTVTLVIHALAVGTIADGPITVREGDHVFPVQAPQKAYDLATTTWTSPPLSAGTHVFHVVYDGENAAASESVVTVTVQAPEPKHRVARH